MPSQNTTLPLPQSPEAPDQDALTIDLFAEEATPMLEALGSETARRIMAEARAEPATPSALAEQVDTTLQNVTYHLDRLHDAGLVEVIATQYSTRGKEMQVYAAAHDPIVFVAGDERSRRLVDEETAGDADELAAVPGS